MALTRKIIEAGRANNAELSKEANNMREIADGLYNFTKTSKDFQSFTTDTELGRKLGDMLNILLKKIDAFSETMNTVAKDTDYFLEDQQEINSRSA